MAQKTEFSDLALFESTCKALGLEYKIGRHTLHLFAGQTAEVDAYVKLPDWQYPVGLNVKTGEIFYDNYNGSWGAESKLDEFGQEYQLQKGEQMLIGIYAQDGWQFERRELEDGTKQVVAYK